MSKLLRTAVFSLAGVALFATLWHTNRDIFQAWDTVWVTATILGLALFLGVIFDEVA